MISRKKAVTIFLVLIMVLSLCSCGEKTEDIKTTGVAVVLSGPVTDGAFNQLTCEGSKSVAEENDWRFAYKENIGEEEQLEAVREFAKDGYTTIIGQGGQFGETLAVAAEEFPKVQFIFSVGNVTYDLPNLTAATVDYYEAGYIGGVLAALSTETNRVAMITGEFYENHRLMESGFQKGVSDVNPSIQVQSFTTGDWGDADIAYGVAEKVIAQGFDVLFPCLDAAGAGIAKAAEDDNVKIVGSVADYAKEYNISDVIVGSVAYDWFSLGRLEADESLADGEVHIVGQKDGGLQVVLNIALTDEQQQIYDKLIK